MLKHRIDLLVARSLDAPPSREIERLQALRFVRQVCAWHLLDVYIHFGYIHALIGMYVAFKMDSSTCIRIKQELFWRDK